MWFTENPWPPFLVCAVVAAALLGRWHFTRNGRLLLAALAAVAVGCVILVVEVLIVTESERVEGAVADLAKAFAAGDSQRCVEFFSDRDPNDRNLVQAAAGAVKIVGPIRISDLSIDMAPGQSRAVATFRASATMEFQGHDQHGATRWELTWQKEAGDWKINRLRRLRFFGEGAIQPFAAME